VPLSPGDKLGPYKIVEPVSKVGFGARRDEQSGTSAVVPYYVSDLPTNRGPREPGKATDFGFADPNNKKG
jgi:hypothetical protein